MNIPDVTEGTESKKIGDLGLDVFENESGIYHVDRRNDIIKNLIVCHAALILGLLVFAGFYGNHYAIRNRYDYFKIASSWVLLLFYIPRYIFNAGMAALPSS